MEISICLVVFSFFLKASLMNHSDLNCDGSTGLHKCCGEYIYDKATHGCVNEELITFGKIKSH